MDDSISRKSLRFMATMFGVGTGLGAMASAAYLSYLSLSGGWDPSTSLFHGLVLFFGLAITVPMLSTSLRMLYNGLVLSERGLKQSERLAGFAERGEPMLSRVERMIDLAESDRGKELINKLEDALERIGHEFGPQGAPPSTSRAVEMLRSRSAQNGPTKGVS